MASTPVRYHLGQFPPQTLDWPRLIPLIGPANVGLARYDGLLSGKGRRPGIFAFIELLNIAEGKKIL